MIFVELATCKFLKYDYYRLNDSISSLSQGILNQVSLDFSPLQQAQLSLTLC